MNKTICDTDLCCKGNCARDSVLTFLRLRRSNDRINVFFSIQSLFPPLQDLQSYSMPFILNILDKRLLMEIRLGSKDISMIYFQSLIRARCNPYAKSSIYSGSHLKVTNIWNSVRKVLIDFSRFVFITIVLRLRLKIGDINFADWQSLRCGLLK